MNTKQLLIATITLAIVMMLNASDVTAQGPRGGPKKPAALTGTAFTYQGQLKQSGTPVTNTCGFHFGLWDAATGGSQIGVTQTVSSVSVTNGLFTTPITFTSDSAFIGEARWLQSRVRCPDSGSYSTLDPRQALTPAPIAFSLPGLYTQQNVTSTNIIGGFSGNNIVDGVVGGTISGGGASGELNRVNDDYGTVGGGLLNRAGDTDGDHTTQRYATVGGGNDNHASSGYSVIGGGSGNTANGILSAILGGEANNASGSHGTIGGGAGNTASGSWSTVAGGYQNTAAGQYSFVAGNRAKNTDANHDGVFLFADTKNFDFPSTAADQFRVRSTGGVEFVLGVDGSGNATWTCSVTYANSWSCSSDRNLKENFMVSDGRDLLARLDKTPIYFWNAKGANQNKHLGPTAQDFYAAFHLGDSDTSISTIDLDGVALAAIQGLSQIVQEKNIQVADLESQVAELKKQNRSFESRLTALEQANAQSPSLSR